MKFETISELFEKLEGTSKRLEKIQILKDFYSENPKETPLIFDIVAGNFQREINKKTIGISLKTLFSCISFATQISENIIEKNFNKIGDIGEVAKITFENSKIQQTLSSNDLTLESITSAFKEISEKTGINSNKRKKEILTRLFLSAKKPIEQKFLGRLLLDDLRIGTSEGTLREACVRKLFPKIIPDESREEYNNKINLFEKKYSIVNSFRIVLEDLNKNPNNLLKSEIILGTPLKSMLGTREQTVEAAIERIGIPCLSDYKYDGLRVQIHNDKGKIKLFSRNLDEITKQFPEIIEFMKDNFSDISCILDTECVGFNPKNKKYLPFQTLSKRILTKDIHSVFSIKVVVRSFDILYLNGKTLIDEPYEKRREIMESLFVNRELSQINH